MQEGPLYCLLLTLAKVSEVDFFIILAGTSLNARSSARCITRHVILHLNTYFIFDDHTIGTEL